VHPLGGAVLPIGAADRHRRYSAEAAQSAPSQRREQAGRRDGNGPATRSVRAQLPFGHRDGAVERLIQPAIQGRWVGGLQRAEYTVGVEGCNQPHHVRRPLSDRHRHLLRGEPPGPVPAIRRRPLGAESTPYGSRDSSGCPVVAYERDFGNGTDPNLQLRGPLMALGFVF